MKEGRATQMSADLPLTETSLSSLPSNLIPLIAHHLQLRHLLLWSSTNRFFRSVICPEVRHSTPPSRHPLTADCWRFVPGVEVRWGKTTPHWGRNQEDVVSLELDGCILPAVTLDIQTALKVPASPALPTIAEEFAGKSLSPALFDTSLLPPAPALPSEPLHPMIPSLAAVVRSLRFVRRLLYTQSEENVRVLLTVLTVLPSFPLLHHFALRYEVYTYQQGRIQPPTPEQREQDLIHSSALVNGIFGCLISLPSLSSLELYGHLRTVRRHPNRQVMWMDQQMATDVISTMLRERLIHVRMSTHLFRDWERKQEYATHPHNSTERFTRARAQAQVQAREQETVQMMTVSPALHVVSGLGWNHLGLPPTGDCGVLLPQFSSLLSLDIAEGDGIPLKRLLQLFPSLVVLRTRLHHSFDDQEPPSTRRPQREAPHEGEDRDEPSSRTNSAHPEPALRFLKTQAHIRDLPEVRTLVHLNFLHSLCLDVGL